MEKMCLDDGQRRDKPNTLILCYPSVLPQEQLKRFKRLQRRSILRKQEEEGELNALGMLPLSSIRAITLLMTSATSSLTLSLHKMFFSGQLSISEPFQTQRAANGLGYSLFLKYLSHDTCSHSYGTLFPFSGRVIYFENKCWLVVHIATAFINSYHLHFNSA